MGTAISVVIFILSVFLILIVLVQNSKGGGLSSTFASSNQIMGVRKTTDFLEKATWFLAGFMLFLCVISAYVTPTQPTAQKSAIEDKINTTIPMNTTPVFPGSDAATATPSSTEAPANTTEAPATTN